MKAKSFAIGALVAVGALLGTGTASAETDIPWTYTTDDNPGGKAKFTAHGDRVTVCDEQADGWGVVAKIRRASNNEVFFEINDSNASDGCKEKTKNIPDGVDVELHVCLYKDGQVWFCETKSGVA
ncbi:hypothetical protein ACIA8G_09495 [Lentzea sp. NPDC051213]|uniref:hypothetical protein n=1 Tax=Lentzea sp. NPDC051213 TaxID=3364126 RepID=UPI0037B412AF